MTKITEMLACFLFLTIFSAISLHRPATVSAAEFANGNGSAEIYTVLDIKNDDGLDFGVYTVSTAGGNVYVNADGSDHAPDAGIAFVGGQATTSRGQFTVTGHPGASYNINGSDPEVELSKGGIVLTADLEWFSKTAEQNGGSGVLSPTGGGLTGDPGNGILGFPGEDTLYVGGTLFFPANPVPHFYVGTFSGTYQVTVNYN